MTLDELRNRRDHVEPPPDEWPVGTRFGFCPHCGAETTLYSKPEGGGSATHPHPPCAAWLANPLAMLLLPDEYLVPTAREPI